MKTLSVIIFQILTVFIISFSAIAEDKVSIAAEHWPPWLIAHDKNKENVTDGLAINLSKEIFSRIGYDIQIITVPWKRMLYRIEKGDSDVIPMLLKTPEREKYMLFTIPVYIDPLVIAYSGDKFKNFEWEKWEDLKPYSIGTVKGYAYGGLNKAEKDHGLRLIKTDTDGQNIRTLIAGRMELSVIYYSAAKKLFQDIPGSEKLRFCKKSINQSQFHFGISKKSFLAMKIDEINKTIKQMQDDGTFKKIFKEYYINTEEEIN